VFSTNIIGAELSFSGSNTSRHPVPTANEPEAKVGQSHPLRPCELIP
jgi:hypothetical protein